MSTVADVINRVYREYLFAPDEQPTTVTLNGALTAAASSLTYSAATLLPDEEGLLGPGLIVECDLEQMLITAVNTATRTLTLTRGVNGTTATTHNTGAFVSLNPHVSRQTVFDSVCDEVERLGPPLRNISSFAATAGPTIVEVPATVTGIREVLLTSGTRPTTASSQLLPFYPASSTGKAALISGSGACVVVTEGVFARPDSLTYDLAANGVPDVWLPILVAGTAGHVIMSRDVDSTDSQYVTEQLEVTQVPIPAGERVARSLLRYRKELLEEAVARQRSEFKSKMRFTNPLSATSGSL